MQTSAYVRDSAWLQSITHNLIDNVVVWLGIPNISAIFVHDICLYIVRRPHIILDNLEQLCIVAFVMVSAYG